jgi:hypothetical protein
MLVNLTNREHRYTGDNGKDGNRRQRAVRHGFNSGHMKGGMYMKGTGQQKTNSRCANNFGDGKWPYKPGGEFAGFNPEGQIPGG